MNLNERTYTESQVKDIIHKISYEDVYSEEDYLAIIRLVIALYSKARGEKAPECLAESALHNAVRVGIQKYYEMGGT